MGPGLRAESVARYSSPHTFEVRGRTKCGLAGGVAPQTFDVPLKYASGLRGSARPSFDFAQDGEPVEPSRVATPGYPLLFQCNGCNATNRHELCALLVYYDGSSAGEKGTQVRVERR